jgi:cytochrome c biogenesis protein CcmG, thiol:disulfide interchange protein DsbE
MKKILYLLVVIALVTMSGCNRKESDMANRSISFGSQPAPDVTVNSLDGTTLRLSSLKGKVVLLNFWATWCPPCREEIPSMIKLNKLMAGKPFQMVAISINEGGKPEVESYFQSSGLSLPAYTDPDNRAARAYGVTGVPESYIIDKNGIIVKKVIGPLSWDSPEVITFLEERMK